MNTSQGLKQSIKTPLQVMFSSLPRNDTAARARNDVQILVRFMDC